MTRSIPIIIAVVCFLVLSSPTSSQTKPQALVIDGIVVDQNGDPVPAAVVTYSAGALTTPVITDNEGLFRFEATSNGSALLTIKANSFATTERKIDPATEQVTGLRIVLSPANISAQVTISATRTETRLSETAASVVVLNSNDLKTTAAVTLEDALRQAARF